LARPFRYTFILMLVAVSTTLAAVGGWRFARASAPVSGPIILISIDSLRADRLPLYGYTGVATPTLDALGDDGIVFERAYSHAPLTLPAHASLLSGRLPFETGVRAATGMSINSRERMLAEILSDRGYATGAVVSSFALRRATGIAQGFGFFDDKLAAESSAGDEPLLRDGSLSVQIAERWLDTIGTSRAFLFLHLAEPHKPYDPPERFAAYDPYDGEVAYADEIVGQLVRYLKRHQLYDQSTIIVLSDHGEGLGDHGEQEHGLFVYDEAVRVPLIIKPSAGDGAGRRVTDVVQHIDVVPTILDLAKAPVPDNLGGDSLVPFLDGDGTLPSRLAYAESLFGHFNFGWTAVASLTDGRYRLVRSTSDRLYDLKVDPAGRLDVSGVHLDVTKKLGESLDRLLADSSIPQPPDVSARDRQRFEALGDVVASTNHQAGGEPVAELVNAYRTSVDCARTRDWVCALDVLDAYVSSYPESSEAWARLGAIAERGGRSDLALDAYRKVVALRRDDAHGHLGAATSLWRLRRPEEAKRHAEQAAVLAAHDAVLGGSARELLARIALGRRDAIAARAEAARAAALEPGRPVTTFIEARLLQEQRLFDDAWPLFDAALAELRRSNARPIADLHFYAAQTLANLYRYPEAEFQFFEELKQFPLNSRARAELASMYHGQGRTDEAIQMLIELARTMPTAEALGTASRLAQSFGDPQQAAAFRLEAQRLNRQPRAAGQH
jgi:tetratricopeptide (TPR) repeat protein